MKIKEHYPTGTYTSTLQADGTIKTVKHGKPNNG